MGTKASKRGTYSVPSRVVGSTDFEDLSNELIYEVFDYLSFHDISFAFIRLNQRLESLIHTHSHYLNLQQHIHADIATFPRWIHSLKITARYQFSLIDFAHLRSVHNLLLSNVPAAFLQHIFSTISLHDLRYVYLGACPHHHTFEETQLGQVQEKVLASGQWSLQRCVFRMQLFANVDVLPRELPTLEYLRIDGCENLSIVSKLLDRMPRLKSLQASVLKRSLSGQDELNRPPGKHIYLTNLTLRMHEWRSTDELMPLLTRHCSNYAATNLHLKGLRQWITTSVQPLLPHLRNFFLRQCLLLRLNESANELYLKPPFQENIPCPLEGKSYCVTVAAHLTSLWNDTI